MLHVKPEAFVPATRPAKRIRWRAAVRSAWQAYLAWLGRQAVRRALSELDDRMLKDIGISRAEIDAVAYGHYPRRVGPRPLEPH